MIGELLSNPLIIAIIIGLLTTIFNKIFKEKKQEDTNPRAPVSNRPPRKQESENEASMSKVPDISEEISSIQNRYEKQKEELQTRLNETGNHIIQTKRKQAKKADGVSNRALPLNKESVVQGFIFGEVFGAPRAKNPHRSMKRYKKN